MSVNPRNIAPFLRTSRLFPDDNAQSLSVEINKAYVDTASAVNSRTISIFPTNVQGLTGEIWALSGMQNNLQGLRRVYTFASAGSYPHGINFTSVAQFTKCSGSYTDGTNWYGTIYGSSIAGNVTFYLTPINLVIVTGLGAPAISFGSIVLEWVAAT